MYEFIAFRRVSPPSGKYIGRGKSAKPRTRLFTLASANPTKGLEGAE